MEFHKPVMAHEVKDFLINDRDGIYLDGTLGGAGHAEYILQYLSRDARYIGLDQDPDSIEFAKKRLSKYKNTKIYKCNFVEFRNVLNMMNLNKINGFFFDLGVSSFQIDNEIRGFSYLKNSELDMRMDKVSDIRARDIINNYLQEDLKNVFKNHGEEKYAAKIAGRIVQERGRQLIETTSQLKEIIDKVIHPRFRIKSYARIFQALRIEVNRELKVLRDTLKAVNDYLLPGGRVVIIAYHSLEDRIVKQFLQRSAHPCICPPDLPVCVCNKKPEIKILTKKPVKAQPEEIKTNVRARSALLRAGDKL